MTSAWTTEKPVVVGWYWYEPVLNFDVIILYVLQRKDGSWVATVANEVCMLEKLHGKWQGPLTPKE